MKKWNWLPRLTFKKIEWIHFQEMGEMTPAQARGSHTLIHTWKCQLFSEMRVICMPKLVLCWLLTLCGWPYTSLNKMISQCMVEAPRISRPVPCSSLLGCASLPAFHTRQLRHPVASFQTCLSTAYMTVCLSLTPQVLHNQVHTYRDFPGGPVVENPPCNAGMQVGSLVRELRCHMLQGNQAHVPQLLKPMCWEPALHN